MPSQGPSYEKDLLLAGDLARADYPPFDESDIPFIEESLPSTIEDVDVTIGAIEDILARSRLTL